MSCSAVSAAPLASAEKVWQDCQQVLTSLAECGSLLLQEAVKVTLVAGALLLFTTTLFPGSSLAFALLVVAPVCEEIFFRGILQTAIDYAGKAIDLIDGYEPTETDLKSREQFRVRISALLFGLAHTLSPRWNVRQVVLATFAGINAGYCRERSGSIVPGILYHAASNFFIYLSYSNPGLALPCLIGYAVTDLACYGWVTS
jgi:membrane protease YdiL (CAAX protease family)